MGENEEVSATPAHVLVAALLCFGSACSATHKVRYTLPLTNNTRPAAARKCLARCQSRGSKEDALVECLAECPGFDKAIASACPAELMPPAGFCIVREQEHQTARTLSVNIAIAAIVIIGITLVGVLSPSEGNVGPPP